MASYSQLKSGLWRVQVARAGVRLSQTFTTKTAARLWAVREEAALIDGTASKWPRKTLLDAMRRYEKEITPGKGSAKFERIAFGVIAREAPALCGKLLHAITAEDLAGWLKVRGAGVSGSTVVRYASVLRNVWTVAARQWEWTPEPTPWRRVTLPKESAPRDRLIGWREARAILRRLNYCTNRAPTMKMEQTAWAFLLGLRTAMRASEILGLTGESVDLKTRVVTLAHHKTIHRTGRARQVPLTRQAARLLAQIHKPGLLFDLTAGSLDALFRKARDQSMVVGVHFHDSRAAALTYLAQRVPVEVLARISGHRDVSLLIGTYYRESSQEIAKRL